MLHVTSKGKQWCPVGRNTCSFTAAHWAVVQQRLQVYPNSTQSQLAWTLPVCARHMVAHAVKHGYLQVV